MNKTKYDSLARWICAVAFCAWVYVLDLKYYNFGYWSWDLPLYANLMWNLCHGSLNSSLFGGNFLIDHFDGIAFLLVPFYYFFQSALTLLVFKLLAFFIGAYVFYLLASKRLGGFWGMMFMLGYMFYPPNMSMLFFEFNFENLALPLIFMLFYFFEENNFLCFLVCCFLMTIVKENMPLVVVMFGLYGFLKRREGWARWGLCPLLLGGLMFTVEVFIIPPWLRNGLESRYWHLYFGTAPTHQGIFNTFFYQQGRMVKLLFTPHNFSFLSELFGPLLTITLLSPQILLLGLPLFLQNLLSSFSGQQSIDYFYASTLTVFIFMASADFFHVVDGKDRERLVGIMMVLLFLFDIWYMPYWGTRIPPYKERQAVDDYLLSRIPPEARVLTTYNYLYFLSQRKGLYVIGQGRNAFTHKSLANFQDVDYALVDFSAPRIDDKRSVKWILTGKQWTVQAGADQTILLKKNAGRGERLIESQKKPLVAQAFHPDIILGDTLRLDDIDIPSTLTVGHRIVRVVFYWKALKKDPNRKLPQISFRIYQGPVTRYSKNRVPFYGLPLEKDEYDKDTFYYFIPKLGPGDYGVEIKYPLPSEDKGKTFRILRPLRMLPERT